MSYQKSILLSIMGISAAAAAHAGLRSSVTNFNSALAGVSPTTNRGAPSLGLEGDNCDYDCECTGSLNYCFKLTCDNIGFCSTDEGNCDENREDKCDDDDSTTTTTTTTSNDDRCDNPSSTEESRSGDTYEFKREGSSGRICNDSKDRKYDYGEYELGNNDDAEDCAQACVDDPAKSTLKHLVGYDWKCEDSLCRCLYEDGKLSESERDDFDSFDRSNSGSGSVDGTESKNNWQCYKLDDVTGDDKRGGNNGSSDNEDCEPETAEQNRRGIKYEFERFGGSDRVCNDSDDNKYDYGLFELRDDDEADDCATKCVNKPDRDTLEHLIGFDWNCDKSLCRCLYENNELSGSDEKDFDSFDNDNNGEGNVEHTERKDDWRCYKLKYATPISTENMAVA